MSSSLFESSSEGYATRTSGTASSSSRDQGVMAVATNKARWDRTSSVDRPAGRRQSPRTTPRSDSTEDKTSYIARFKAAWRGAISSPERSAQGKSSPCASNSAGEETKSLLPNSMLVSGGPVPEIPLGQLKATMDPTTGVLPTVGGPPSFALSDVTPYASVIERAVSLSSEIVSANTMSNNISTEMSGQVHAASDFVASVRTTVTNISQMAGTLQESMGEQQKSITDGYEKMQRKLIDNHSEYYQNAIKSEHVVRFAQQYKERYGDTVADEVRKLKAELQTKEQIVHT